MRVRDLGVLIKRETWRERSGESERSRVLIKRETWRERSGESERSRGLNKERDMERKKR